MSLGSSSTNCSSSFFDSGSFKETVAYRFGCTLYGTIVLLLLVIFGSDYSFDSPKRSGDFSDLSYIGLLIIISIDAILSLLMRFLRENFR